MSHHHPAFLLGQALAALTDIAAAADLDSARAVASDALAGIVPAADDIAGVMRGARAPLNDGVADRG